MRVLRQLRGSLPGWRSDAQDVNRQGTPLASEKSQNHLLVLRGGMPVHAGSER